MAVSISQFRGSEAHLSAWGFEMIQKCWPGVQDFETEFFASSKTAMAHCIVQWRSVGDTLERQCAQNQKCHEGNWHPGGKSRRRKVTGKKRREGWAGCRWHSTTSFAKRNLNLIISRVKALDGAPANKPRARPDRPAQKSCSSNPANHLSPHCRQQRLNVELRDWRRRKYLHVVTRCFGK